MLMAVVFLYGTAQAEVLCTPRKSIICQAEKGGVFNEGCERNDDSISGASYKIDFDAGTVTTLDRGKIEGKRDIVSWKIGAFLFAEDKNNEAFFKLWGQLADARNSEVPTGFIYVYSLGKGVSFDSGTCTGRNDGWAKRTNE
jgi:hypothetical protein